MQLTTNRKITSLFDLIKTTSKKKVNKVWKKINKKKSKSMKHKDSIDTTPATSTTTIPSIIITKKACNTTNEINDTKKKDDRKHVSYTSKSSISSSIGKGDDQDYRDIPTNHDKSKNNINSNNVSSPISSPSNNSIKTKIMRKFLKLNQSVLQRIDSVNNVLSKTTTNKDKTQSNEDDDDDDDQLSEYKDEITNQIKLMKEEWNTMNNMYMKETNKRKSRLTLDDIETQHALLTQLRDKIYNIPTSASIGISIIHDLDIDDAPIIITPSASPMISVTNTKSISPHKYSNNNNNDHYYPSLSLTPNTTISKETLRAEEECKPIELDYTDDWWTQEQQEQEEEENGNNNNVSNSSSTIDIDKNDIELEVKLSKIDDMLSNIHCIVSSQNDQVNKHSGVMNDMDRKNSNVNDKLNYMNRKVIDIYDCS